MNSGKIIVTAERVRPEVPRLVAWLLRVRFLRKFWHLCERIPPFLGACFSARGLVHPEGRQLVLGKLRRSFLSLSPALARRLQRRYGLAGGCTSCGASCNMLFRCPHWDAGSRLCTVYEDRPSICRTFPITPADLRDRDIANRRSPCGFHFER